MFGVSGTGWGVLVVLLVCGCENRRCRGWWWVLLVLVGSVAVVVCVEAVGVGWKSWGTGVSWGGPGYTTVAWAVGAGASTASWVFWISSKSVIVIRLGLGLGYRLRWQLDTGVLVDGMPLMFRSGGFSVFWSSTWSSAPRSSSSAPPGSFSSGGSGTSYGDGWYCSVNAEGACGAD